MRRLIPAIPIVLAASVAPVAARADSQLMIAVARIFDGRYALKFDTRYRIGPNIDLQMTGDDSATISGTGLSFWRVEDSKCMFRMGPRRGAAIDAQIDFSRLSDEYSFVRGIDGSNLVVHGSGPAVCDHTWQPGRLTCFADYRSIATSHIPDILRAFRFVFSSACEPLQLPLR